MTVTSISYSRTIPTGSYSNEKLGVEIEISKEESPELAFEIAKDLVEKMHRQNNPHLYPVYSPPIATPPPYLENQPTTSKPQEEEVKRTIPLSKEEKRKLKEEEDIANINRCNSIEELSAYKLIANSNAAVKASYQLKELQLKKQ